MKSNNPAEPWLVDVGGGPPELPPAEPVDIADFSRMTATPPPSAPPVDAEVSEPPARPPDHDPAQMNLPDFASPTPELGSQPVPMDDEAAIGWDLEGARPFAPAAPVPPEPLAPAMTGPVGRRRSPAAVVALSVLTLGLYAIVWHAKVNREMSDFDFGLTVQPGKSATAVAIAWVIGFGVTAVGVARSVVTLAHLSFDPQITALQGYVLLPGVLAVPILELLLPFSLVAMVMTIERLRLVEAHSGLATDEQVRPSALVWSLLVPVVGGLILLASAQIRLNATWARAAERATPAGWGFNYGQ